MKCAEGQLVEIPNYFGKVTYSCPARGNECRDHRHLIESGIIRSEENDLVCAIGEIRCYGLIEPVYNRCGCRFGIGDISNPQIEHPARCGSCRNTHDSALGISMGSESRRNSARTFNTHGHGESCRRRLGCCLISLLSGSSRVNGCRGAPR